jgi:uncharacterized small protein (DUF1192 family)
MLMSCLIAYFEAERVSQTWVNSSVCRREGPGSPASLPSSTIVPRHLAVRGQQQSSRVLMDAVDALDARITQLDREIAALQAERAALQVKRAALRAEWNARTPIGRLPLEVLAMIMRYFCKNYDVYGTTEDWPSYRTTRSASERLSFAHDIHAIASVCRQIRRASSHMLWKYTNIEWDWDFESQSADVRVVLSKVSPATNSTFKRCVRVTSLFIVFDAEFLESHRVSYEGGLPIDPWYSPSNVRIQFTQQVQQADAFEQILDTSAWNAICRLTLDGSDTVLKSFPVDLPSLEHLELNDMTLPLGALYDLVDEAPNLTSITLVDVSALEGPEGARPTPVEHKMLANVRLAGDAEQITSALTLAPHTTKNLEVELTMSREASDEDLELYDAITTRLIDFWRRAHGTAYGFSSGAVYVGTTPSNLTMIHFWEPPVPGLSRMSWKIIDFAPDRTPKSLLEHVHVLELNCQHTGAIRFAECLPLWPKLTTVRILRCSYYQWSHLINNDEKIGRIIKDWLLKRAQTNQPLPSVHFRSCSAYSETWVEQLVAMGWNNTITWGN